MPRGKAATVAELPPGSSVDAVLDREREESEREEAERRENAAAACEIAKAKAHRGPKVVNKARSPLLDGDVSWELSSDPKTIDICRLYLRQKQQKVAESTFYDSVWTLTHFTASFGDKPVSELRAYMLEAWPSDHGSWGPHTQAHKLGHIKACFNWAASLDLIPKNAFSRVKRRAGEPREDVKDDEFQSLLRVAGARFKQILIFMDHVGCRTCEVRELRWDQIDWSGAVAVQKKHKTARTARVRRDRVLYLDSVAIKLLRWIHDHDPFVVQQRRDGQKDGFVFLNARGKPWKRGWGLAQKLLRLRRKAGIREQVKLYSMRHRYGTAAGRVVDIVTLGRLMGHNNIATTQRYCHVDAEHLKRSVSKIAAARSARTSGRQEGRP